jgi:hypothetical protein
VRLSLGCDMGVGNKFSIINVLDEAYKVGKCNNTLLDGSVDPRNFDASVYWTSNGTLLSRSAFLALTFLALLY